MNNDLQPIEFWLAVAAALIVKVKTTARFGPLRVATTVAVAIAAAWTMTDWTAQTLGVPVPVAAAIVTLTAEGVMRWLLLAVDDPKQAIDLWKYWRR
ncbi:hypothetical protein SAMN05444389_101454 [Paracoccus solventivorans]|uniref:Uncharacterized protein n=1 Tax=Paracoccus solventivorans TaxID=53463 RepID=A0A1M7DN16_9RHOB|nr:hypothetical protein [Paracoccus solventivorans]SHL80870.1 hypothetical protein SAMN05444389_101454 [Paracoccus solventivorans]HHW34405.1 hypothetical protein [Paracoccus solventivorans]